MSPIGSQRPDRNAAAAPAPHLDADDPTAWSSGEFARLFIAPAVMVLLFVGGVYWIRQQLPAGAVGQTQNSIVQVQLLPRPDAIPIAVAATPPSVTDNVVSRVDTPSKVPDPTPSDDPPAVQQAKLSSPADVLAPNVRAAPSTVSGPPSSAAIKFQQALLRHVARYQRYPSAARPLRLEGRVDTQFAMSRDGTLLGVWVKTSSGQVMLDKEAIDTIMRAQPLPHIPPELPDRLNVHVQLVFDPS
jgi:protein TonB